MNTQIKEKPICERNKVIVDLTIESTLPELNGNHLIVERQSSPNKKRQFIATVTNANNEPLRFVRLDYFPLIIGTVLGELLDCPVTIKLHDIGQLREGYRAVITATSSLYGAEEKKSESVDKLGCMAITKAAIKATESLFANKN